ncbi:Trehalose-phosphate phosphatase A [Galdieria sulphuraria]|nr:Trehalose-phosphate phosphatase A [Galdieria sulphuraria]
MRSGNRSPRKGNIEEVGLLSTSRGKATLNKNIPSPQQSRNIHVPSSSSFRTLSKLSSPAASDALRPIFFLDFDGTLANIVSNPDMATLTTEMHETLRRLAEKYAVAIISGRSRKKLKELVDLQGVSGLLYAGSHGFDIGVPSDEVGGDISYHPKLAESFLPTLREVRMRIMSEVLPKFKGVTLEDNAFSLSIHYRNIVSRDSESGDIQMEVDRLESEIDRIVEPFRDQLEKTFGRKVFEIRLLLNWNKGQAVRWLLHIFSKGISESWNDKVPLNEKIKETQFLAEYQDLSLSSSPLENMEEIFLQNNLETHKSQASWYSESSDSPFFPLYFGDDITDEDAFQVLQVENGIGIVVTEISRPTGAKYRLRNPDEVQQFLDKFLTE